MKMKSMTCVELGNHSATRKAKLPFSASFGRPLNNRGFLVFDFMFAFLIVIGMSMLLLITNYTLSMMEVVQYMTFASSRSYYASDISEEEQKNSATAKFESLREQNILKNLLNKNLFAISSTHGDHSAHFEDGNSTGSGNTAGSGNNKNLIGTKTSVSVKVLSKALPLLGSAGSEDDFQTTVVSLLGREPSMEECMSAINKKAELIQGLYGELESFKATSIWDNGC